MYVKYAFSVGNVELVAYYSVVYRSSGNECAPISLTLNAFFLTMLPSINISIELKAKSIGFDLRDVVNHRICLKPRVVVRSL